MATKAKKKLGKKSVFAEKSPKIMADLMAEFEIDKVMAAGILGNIGVESGGFRYYHEIGQPEGKGGYGWCQWTGPRRKSFFAFCDGKKLDRMSDEASYAYLVHELSNSPYHHAISALLKTKTLAEAVKAFERNFEQAGKPNYTDRNKYAAIALQAFENSSFSS